MWQTRQWRNPRNGSTQRSAELGRGVRVPDGEQGEEFQLKEGESAAPGISPQFHSFRTNAQLSHCSTTEHQFDGEFLTNGRNTFNVRSSKMNAQNLRIFPESLSKADSSGA